MATDQAGPLAPDEAAAVAPDRAQTGALASIHDLVMTRDAGLVDQLHYDPYERRSGLVRFLPLHTDAHAWEAAEAVELGDAVDGVFEVAGLEMDRLVATRDATVHGPSGPTTVRVTKDLVLGGERRSPTLTLTVTVENRSAVSLEARLGVEWTLTMLGGGGNPAAWWDVDGRRTSHDSRGTADGLTVIAQGNDFIGVAVTTSVSEPADAWWAPVETISNSESGFEHSYQGAGLLLSWPIALAPGASRAVTLTHAVTTTHDRADEEIGALTPTPGDT